MSLTVARKKRTSLLLGIAGLMVMVAAVSAISARDPSGVSLRVGMVMLTVGGALWLPWRLLIPAAVIAWLAPNLGRSLVDDVAMFNLNMLMEAPGLAGIAFFTLVARDSLRQLEESYLIGGMSDELTAGPATGIYHERQLRPALEAELARSRRFGRTFSLVLVGIDEMRQKFDYRDGTTWQASLDATRRLLSQTRTNVDRVFQFRDENFAIILPESSSKDIPGLVRRLRRIARTTSPAEGEPGGPLPVHFGATFFPEGATTVEDLLRRAEVALRIAAGSMTRYQLDGAEAPEMPAVESLRREKGDLVAATAVARQPLLFPPPVSHPAAAEIVSEACEDRRQTPVESREEQRLDSLPSATQTTRQQEPASAVEGGQPSLPEPDQASVAAAEEASPAPEPVVAANGDAAVRTPDSAAIAEDAVQPGVATALNSQLANLQLEGVDALLQELDETLKLIRSVRNHAA